MLDLIFLSSLWPQLQPGALDVPRETCKRDAPVGQKAHHEAIRRAAMLIETKNASRG